MVNSGKLFVRSTTRRQAGQALAISVHVVLRKHSRTWRVDQMRMGSTSTDLMPLSGA